MRFEWRIREHNKKLADALSRGLGISKLTAISLSNRGIKDVSAARCFLQKDVTKLQEPGSIPGFTRALERINRALAKKERIGIMCDADADGLTGCATLNFALKFFTDDMVCIATARVSDGYGLTSAVLERVRTEKVKLLITVDCCTNNYDAVQTLKESGVDTIVVDHHEPSEMLSSNAIVVNPKLGFGHREMCSSGLCLKLGLKLVDRLPSIWKNSADFTAFMTNAFAFAAIGTIADVSQMSVENRTIISFGLDCLKQSTHPGLKYLVSKIPSNEDVDVGTVQMHVAPRINSIGRMGSPEYGLTFLIGISRYDYPIYVKSIEEANTKRYRQSRQAKEEAIGMLTRGEIDSTGSCVIFVSDKWKAPIAGIIASHLSAVLTRPVLVMIGNGKAYKGSARSPEGINIHAVIEKCRTLLEDFGGHPNATGFTIKGKNIKEFSNRVRTECDLAGESLAMPVLGIDAVAPATSLNYYTANELSMLSPFGFGNAEPLFVIQKMHSTGNVFYYGRGRKKLVTYIRPAGIDSTPPIKCLATEEFAGLLEKDRPLNIAGHLRIDEYLENKEASFQVKDAVPAA